MKTNEELREQTHLSVKEMADDGGYGIIDLGKLYGTVIWSTGGGWEHVSVSAYNHRYTPSWEDMCRVKTMFFYPEEWVVQFHPAESEYVNTMPNCLHLWRPTAEIMPTPPSWMV